MTVLTNEQAINKLQDILEQYWKLDKKGFVMDFDTAEAIKMGAQALDNQKEIIKGFTVIDTKTGRYPDLDKLVDEYTENDNLAYYNLDCFAITEGGDIILLDTDFNFRVCPLGRFKIKPIYYK